MQHRYGETEWRLRSIGTGPPAKSCKCYDHTMVIKLRNHNVHSILSFYINIYNRYYDFPWPVASPKVTG